MLGFIRLVDDDLRQNDKPLHLNHLQTQELATVLAIDSSNGLSDRLRAVGIVPGVAVRLLRRGTAVVVHTEGGRFCLREEDARRITVEPVVAEARAA